MKLGIKIAPGNSYKYDIQQTHPSMVEVWYNATKPSGYTGMFSYLKTQNLDVGLHFWGTLTGNILPNMSYPNPEIQLQSYALIKQTIDIAADNGFSYVNIHPDLFALLQVDFKTMNIQTITKPADMNKTISTFVTQVTRLHNHARSRGIVLTVETVPIRDAPTWNPNRDRTAVVDIFQMPINVLIDLAARGLNIANDLCHTACNDISGDRTHIMKFLKDTTITLAAATKLIHLGYVIPPYNGVDFHDSLDNPVLDTVAAIPNNNEIIDLLKLFQNRDDVWMLVEPKEDHVKNFQLAKNLMAKSEAL